MLTAWNKSSWRKLLLQLALACDFEICLQKQWSTCRYGVCMDIQSERRCIMVALPLLMETVVAPRLVARCSLEQKSLCKQGFSKAETIIIYSASGKVVPSRSRVAHGELSDTEQEEERACKRQKMRREEEF